MFKLIKGQIKTRKEVSQRIFKKDWMDATQPTFHPSKLITCLKLSSQRDQLTNHSKCQCKMSIKSLALAPSQLARRNRCLETWYDTEVNSVE